MSNETEQIFLINPSESQTSPISLKTDKTILTPQDVDFSTVCRTCATVTEFVIPIFDGEGLQNNLAEKIHKHLPIQVCEKDILPRVVCYQCASTLLAWHELVQCCVQADAALRTRLAVSAAAHADEPSHTALEPEEASKEPIQDSEQEQQNKFKEIAEFVVQTLDPPEYPAESPARKACGYCGSQYSDDAYKDHLVDAHADLLFHCDECDTYVDRKDFILHMSVHAVEYSDKQDKDAPTPRKREIRVRKKRSKDENENENKKSAERPVRDTCTQKDGKKDGERNKVNGDNQENEFSDHSDAEYGFGPLPTSVFEAIEDSQDSQPISDETSSKAENKQPEKNDTSNQENVVVPAVLEKSHKKARTCPICGKGYKASSSYFYHLKHFHKGSKDHECDVCGKKFGTKACLVQHRTIHTGECRYACKDCGKRFRAKASLYIHEQTHNGVKTWACSQCHRSFRWRTHLLRHVKRHSAERSHVCDACGRGFSVRCDLLRHERTHTAGDFACDKCGVKFAQVRYLKVHMERKHSAPGNISIPPAAQA